jgi:hypothetical protein
VGGFRAAHLVLKRRGAMASFVVGERVKVVDMHSAQHERIGEVESVAADRGVLLYGLTFDPGNLLLPLFGWFKAEEIEALEVEAGD